MPTVPRLTGPQVALQPLRPVYQSAANATPDAFGATAARSTQRAGQMISQASDALSDIVIREQIEDNERNAKELDVEYSKRLRTIMWGDGTEENPGFRNMHGENALRARQATVEAMNKARKELLDSAPNPRVAEMFDLASTVRLNAEMEDVSAFVSRERVVANNAMTEARVQEAADSAAVGWNDSANIKRQLGITAGEISEYAERNGLSPEAAASKMQAAQTNILEAAITAALVHGPAQAQSVYEEFKSFIDGTARARIEKNIKAARDSLLAEARAEVRDLMQDHLISIQTTGVGLPGFADKVRAVMPDLAVQAFERQQSTAFATYETMQALEFATPEEMQTALSDLQPEPGTAGFADRQQAFESAVRAANSILQDRASDPAAYALKDPYVKNLADAASEDPAQVERYVTASLAAQEKMGIPAPQRSALTKSQATSIVQQSFYGDPESWADTMDAMRDQYGRHWPQVWGELVNAKMPLEAQVMGMLDLPTDAIIRKDLASAVKIGLTDLAKGIPEDVKTEIDRNIMDALDPWARLELSRGGTERNVQAVRQAAMMLAYSYAARGDTHAVENAVSGLINDRYELLDSGNFSAYVPRDSADAVEDTGNRLLSQLTPLDVYDPGGAPELTPEQRQGEYLNSLKRGRFILNETGDGLFLVAPNGQPALDVAGNRIEFKIEDARVGRPSEGSVNQDMGDYGIQPQRLDSSSEWGTDNESNITDEEIELALKYDVLYGSGMESAAIMDKSRPEFAQVRLLAHRSAIISFGMTAAANKFSIGQLTNDATVLETGSQLNGYFEPKTDTIVVDGSKKHGIFNPVVAAHEFTHRGLREMEKFLNNPNRSGEPLTELEMKAAEYVHALNSIDWLNEEFTRAVEHMAAGTKATPYEVNRFTQAFDPDGSVSKKMMYRVELVNLLAQRLIKERQPGGPR